MKTFNENRLVGFGLQSKHQSLIEPRRANHFDNCEQPPPLPVKKKHSKFAQLYEQIIFYFVSISMYYFIYPIYIYFEVLVVDILKRLPT